MKLIYITNTRLPSEKANSYQSMQMCHSFAKYYDEVELWTSKSRNNKELENIQNVYSYYNIENNFHIKRFFQFDYKLLAKVNEFIWANTKGFFFALNISIHLLKYRNNQDIVIFTRDWYVLFIFTYLKRIGVFKNKIYFESHKYSNFILKAIEKIDGLVVINHYLASLYKSNIKNLLVAHDGVNITEYQDIPKYKYEEKNRYKVVYTGSLYEWKGIYTLIDSLEYITTEIELISIGGSGEYLSKYKEYIRSKNIKNVKVISHIPKKELLEYIKDADLLILPNSAQDKMSMYTSPIKLFEYMASQRPIIASNLDSLKEILQDNNNAYLFEPDDAKDLAQKIDIVLSKDNTKIVNKAYNDVLEYTWDKRAMTIKEFIEKQKENLEKLKMC